MNAGLRKPDPVPSRLDIDPCNSGASSNAATVAAWGLDGVERNRLGLQATEVLGSGLRAHLQLEQSFKPDSGDLLGPCGLAFDARATVGFSDRRWGRIDLGRKDQAAWLLALEADPWRGSGTASPDWRSYVAPERGATRSSHSVTVHTPDEWPLQATLQLGKPQLSDGSHRWGGSLVWNRLPLLVGVGWQRWPGGAWALPLVAVHDSGEFRLGGAWTTGRVAGVAYSNLFVGASAPFMAVGDPQKHEARIGINLHRVKNQPAGADAGAWTPEIKLGAGWRYRLSRRTWLAAGTGLVKPEVGAARQVFDISLTHTFERNLRAPQGPR